MEATRDAALVVVGAMLLAGYLATVAGPRIRVPKVTLLLLAGVLCGPSVLGVVPDELVGWFPFVARMALAMVGFLLGERLLGKGLKGQRGAVLWISVAETLAAAVAVLICLLAVGCALPVALLLAGIAPASDPASMFETIREGGADGPLSRTVLGVLAIDDAWGVVTFSVLFVIARAVQGAGGGAHQLLLGLWEVLGAAVLGFAVGVPMAWITGRVRSGRPTLVEAMGFVFLTAGLAAVIHVSYLLAAMVLGMVVAARARHHQRPFHEIEGVSEPFLAVFFVMAGLELELGALTSLGLVGAAYVVARVVGLVGGGMLGGALGRTEPTVRRRIGWCLLPQAGVALGLGLLVKEELPDLGETILPLVIATTVLFEIAGPVLARGQLRRAGEWSREEGSAADA